MADDIQDDKFDEALGKLEASQSEEIKTIAGLLSSLRDAVVSLQEQMEGGEEDEDDDD
jgi:hypothetical protein